MEKRRVNPKIRSGIKIIHKNTTKKKNLATIRHRVTMVMHIHTQKIDGTSNSMETVGMKMRMRMRVLEKTKDSSGRENSNLETQSSNS